MILTNRLSHSTIINSIIHSKSWKTFVIFRSKYPLNANYCGRCGVDLHDKTELDPQINSKKGHKLLKKRNVTKDSQSNDKIIKWCQIHALMNYHEMTLPFFLNLVLLLAKGRMDLGFCECSACNGGLRELHHKSIEQKEKISNQVARR